MTSSRNPYEGLYDHVRQGRRGYVVVFTNGCFDILHPGHLKVLRRCREMAGMYGVVVVGVNTDESIRRLKGPNRPIFPLAARMDILKALVQVNYVAAFDEDTPRLLIEAIQPNFIIKGGDYKPSQVVGNDIAHVEIVPTLVEPWETVSTSTDPSLIPPPKPYWSTSDIIERVFNQEWERRRESWQEKK